MLDGQWTWFRLITSLDFYTSVTTKLTHGIYSIFLKTYLSERLERKVTCGSTFENLLGKSLRFVWMFIVHSQYFSTIVAL